VDELFVDGRLAITIVVDELFVKGRLASTVLVYELFVKGELVGNNDVWLIGKMVGRLDDKNDGVFDGALEKSLPHDAPVQKFDEVFASDGQDDRSWLKFDAPSNI